MLSHLNYCLPIWAGLNIKQINTIQVVMNKALRLIFGLKNRESCNDIYLKNKLLKFSDLITFNQLSYMKSLLSKKTPANLKNLIEFQPTLHYSTRTQVDKLRLNETLYKTTSLKNQSINIAILKWNSLNSQLKEQDFKQFKKIIKNNLLEGYKTH